jgi:hypothetical protein
MAKRKRAMCAHYPAVSLFDDIVPQYDRMSRRPYSINIVW